MSAPTVAPETSSGWVLVGLGLLFAAFSVLTWKTWGNPQLDFGVELTTAKRISDGGLLYEDVRYFYGPLGVHALALTFVLLGASFSTAFAFGLVQALTIFAAFFALARSWLAPIFAGAATAVVMAIGFTGGLFSYVAPHTTSATFGLLFLLLEMIALTRGRLMLAGLAVGAALLTRPEFGAVAVVTALAFILGRALEDGWSVALRQSPRVLVPAVLLPVAVFAPFAVAVGPRELVFDQLIPLDFLRVAGLRVQGDWAPFTATSAIALVARALVYVALFAGLVAAVSQWREGKRLAALALPVIAIGGLLVLDGAAHVLNAFPGTVAVVQTEGKRLLLGMSWLPAAAVGVAIWAVVRCRAGRPAPLSNRWSVDLPLIAAALLLSLRAYNDFTTNTYATYYAPPLVLLAVILHQRLAQRYPAARIGAIAAVAAIFAGLAWNAVVIGPAADETFEVRTAHGSYLAAPTSGPAYQRVLDRVRARTPSGTPVLALPLAGGLPFAVDRPPALEDLQLPPGVLDSRADEQEAIARLSRLGVLVVVQGNTRFDAWGYPVIGVDYNRLLVSYIRRHFPNVVQYGHYDDSAAEATAALVVGARAFRLYQRPANGRARE